MLGLRRQGEGLCEHLEESRKAEVEQLVNDAEQQWRTVLQAARQVELRALSDDFDAQSQNTQSWIRARQQQLQSVGGNMPPEERSHTAQVCPNSTRASLKGQFREKLKTHSFSSCLFIHLDSFGLGFAQCL